MKIFISWSGAQSKAIALVLKTWLPLVMQEVRPWVSDVDISKGAMWLPEISKQLKDAKTGIICLTNENLKKPWILFEAGAIAKGLPDNRVCTFLVDLENVQVLPPLSMFQSTIAKKEDVRKLVSDLNNLLDSPLEKNRLDETFDMFWGKFEKDYQRVLAEHPTESVDEAPERKSGDILSEILENTRSLDRRVRDVESIISVDNLKRGRFTTKNILSESELSGKQGFLSPYAGMIKTKDPEFNITLARSIAQSAIEKGFPENLILGAMLEYVAGNEAMEIYDDAKAAKQFDSMKDYGKNIKNDPE